MIDTQEGRKKKKKRGHHHTLRTLMSLLVLWSTCPMPQASLPIIPPRLPPGTTEHPAKKAKVIPNRHKLPPYLRMDSLPVFAHDTIASLLSSTDMYRMMETSSWLFDAYAGRVREVTISVIGTRAGGEVVSTLLSRRPKVERVTLCCRQSAAGLADALKKGYCEQLKALEIMYDLDDSASRSGDYDLGSFSRLLSNGVCPQLSHLVVTLPDDDNMKTRIHQLGAALWSRMRKGCCGLKALGLTQETHKVPLPALSPVLLSGACEGLEQLWLDHCKLADTSVRDLAEWLTSKAHELRMFCCPGVSAFCRPRKYIDEQDADC